MSSTKLSTLLGVMVLAGALGAVAGGAVSFVGQPGGEAESSEVLDRLAELQRDVDGLRDSVKAGKKGVGDLEERLVSAQMDLARMTEEVAAARAATPTVAGMPTIEMPALNVPFTSVPQVSIPHVTVTKPHVLREDVEKAMEEARTHAEEARKRFATSMELRALPEDERWARATDELGLTTAQVNEIKAAKTEFDAAVKDATATETKTTADGATMTFRRMDGKKMQAARRDMDSRIGRTLNPEQQKRWTNDGWKGAMTGAGAMVHRTGLRARDGVSDAPGEISVTSIEIKTETDE